MSHDSRCTNQKLKQPPSWNGAIFCVGQTVIHYLQCLRGFFKVKVVCGIISIRNYCVNLARVVTSRTSGFDALASWPLQNAKSFRISNFPRIFEEIRIPLRLDPTKPDHFLPNSFQNPHPKVQTWKNFLLKPYRKFFLPV